MDKRTGNHKPIQLLPSSGGEGPAAERGRRLLEMVSAMDTPYVFCKDQLVRWKAGLKNRKFPDYNEVAIVREVLTTAVFDGCEQARCAGTPDFGEPLTLVLAILGPDGDFVELHYDGRRFQPAEP